jgi:group II intron reverse transcriptase/maturase
MAGTQDPSTVSTKLRRIAEVARTVRGQPLTNLAHHVDYEWLLEAHRRTRKSGAKGVDDPGAGVYAANLEGNLRSLLERFKAGTYRAPPVRRVHIPKGDGSKTRPIGIPTFEDKVLQRAAVMALEAVYEQDFMNCSYGFRPGRSQHQAIEALWQGLREMRGGWVLEVDIKAYFDSLDHAHLREILDKRVRDGVLRRMIDKWLKAGVWEEGVLARSEEGSPQGGVISPLLANIYLHEVLDVWFASDVQPKLSGPAFLIRYADDFVIVCKHESDVRRIFDVLPKRFGKFGLTIHPEKTKIVRFTRPRDDSEGKGKDDDGQTPGQFDLLGFTHYWGRSQKGHWIVRRKTAASRFRRTLKAIALWCKANRHLQISEQHDMLCKKINGHMEYYGITHNIRAISNWVQEVRRIWKRWLGRRAQHSRMSWARFERLLERRPLPKPRIPKSAVGVA